MTSTCSIYRMSGDPHKLFAHLVQSETVELNGVAKRNAEVIFLAVMESSEDALLDRNRIKRLVLSDLLRPEMARIEWDDTQEVW